MASTLNEYWIVYDNSGSIVFTLPYNDNQLDYLVKLFKEQCGLTFSFTLNKRFGVEVNNDYRVYKTTYTNEQYSKIKVCNLKLKNKMVQEKEKALADAKDGGNYDTAGNSEHYQKQFMELVREQERKYGTIVAYLFCIGNVDKYAGRAGEKAGVPAEKDLIKKSWYQKAARHFKLKIEAERNNTVAPDRNAYVNMPEEVKDLICCEQPFNELFNVGYIPLSIAIEK